MVAVVAENGHDETEVLRLAASLNGVRNTRSPKPS